MVALGVAAWFGARMEKSPPSLTGSAAISPAAVRGASPDTIAADSIAVLPFDNQTGEKDKDYWGDGVAEELINSLSKVPGLQVRSKTSSFAYKGRAEDVRKIARELRVSKVLEGTVQKGGDRVRVNVQLVDGATGQVTVSQNFEEKFANLFTLYDDVSNEVVKRMGVDVGGRRLKSDRPAPPTRDVEAYRLTLQGFAMLNDNGNITAAVDFFLGGHVYRHGAFVGRPGCRGAPV
jgi:adenylate cyclase